jgi:hypothetical protein
MARGLFRLLYDKATGTVRPEYVFSPKQWVFRKVKRGDGTCIVRGVIARHGNDCVIFWIDADENGTLRTTHVALSDSLDGWFKGWYDMGPPYTKATKPNAAKSRVNTPTPPDGAAPGAGTKDDEEEEEEDNEADTPLNKQFTALFARLRDLEARLAPPRAPQIARDARPVAEHLAKLHRKIARTRSLIECDVASMRRVYV